MTSRALLDQAASADLTDVRATADAAQSRAVATESAPVFHDRPRFVRPDAIYCGDCWEPIALQPLVNNPPDFVRGCMGRTGSPKWKHVRTNAIACQPLCDRDGCSADGTSFVTEQVWNGHGFNHRLKHALCPMHLAEYEALRGAPLWKDA